MNHTVNRMPATAHAGAASEKRAPAPPLPPDVLERVNELLQGSNPIAAMALIREETGASLLECRTYVDGLGRKSH